MGFLKPQARQRDNRGFTLIELMIVVVIIGILAALAVPRFSIASMRAKEREADVMLRHVYSMQQAYFSERGMFAARVDDLRTVGFQDPAPGQLKFYTWNGDASIVNGACLASNSTHDSRAVDFVSGEISNC
jgi:prepilin-type N-terminal cleavage/methylation domain-containing protein